MERGTFGCPRTYPHHWKPNSEGMILAQKNEMEYIEVSAKTGSNVYLIFEKLAAQLVKKADKAENNPILSYKLMKKGDQYRETKTGCC